MNYCMTNNESFGSFDVFTIKLLEFLKVICMIFYEVQPFFHE